MSALSTAGIIVKAYDVSWETGLFNPFYNLFDGDLAKKVSGYNHSIVADGGFDIATMSFVDSIYRAGDWYDDGLGRAILVIDNTGQEVFFGVVNRITFVQGNLTSAVGPLMSIANDVMSVYTPMFVDITPIFIGATRFTTVTQDVVSIAKYGQHMLVLNAGEAVVSGAYNEAEQARDTYLVENAFPSDDEQTVGFASSDVSITLDIVGVRHYLDKYYYNNPVAGTTVISGSASGKLEQVLAADPNGIFGGQDIDANPVLTRDFEDQNRTASTIISELLTMGGASYDRWTFGIYDDRTPVYKPIPTTPDYTLRVGETSQITRYGQDTVVYPWEIRPGKWLVLQNAYSGDPILTPTVSANDRRNLFIETVTYTAPFDFQINGVKVSRLSQMIARMGLKGIK